MDQRREPRLDVIIVNWNAGPVLRECIESLGAALPPDVRLDRVVLIDNASADAPIAPGNLTLPLEFIGNARNRGFAAACNQGALGSRADYLLFLNPDVVLGRHAVAAPLAVLEDERHHQVGIVGIQLVDEQGKVTRTSARRPTPGRFLAALLRLHHVWPARLRSHCMLDWDHATTQAVDHVTGAFYLVRRSLFVDLGGFDERFFVYFEDLDFSMRARDAGWVIMYVAEAQALHRGGWATGQGRRVRLYYDWRSRISFARKHFGPGTAALALVVTGIVDPLARVVAGIRRRSGAEVRDSVNACVDQLLGRDPAKQDNRGRRSLA
jgi:GT2 family glycosyltransferase